MKKQFIIIATAISSFALFSCSKEKIETNQEEILSEVPGAANLKPGGNVQVTLNKGLEGLYEFNSTLKEKTGKLGEAVPTTNGGEIFTEDRFGVANAAIKFNGRYGVSIFDVPLVPNMSVAAWVKYDSLPQLYNYFLNSEAPSPEFMQQTNEYWGVISTPSTIGIPGGSSDDHWHHLVATYDAVDLKFYVDGVFVGSINNPSGGNYIPGSTVFYQVGFTTFYGSTEISSVWYGAIDDLRFYSRTLSATDVQKLYAL